MIVVMIMIMCIYAYAEADSEAVSDADADADSDAVGPRVDPPYYLGVGVENVLVHFRLPPCHRASGASHVERSSEPGYRAIITQT